MLLCKLLTELHLGDLQLVLPIHTYRNTHTLQADTLFHAKSTHSPWVPEL